MRNLALTAMHRVLGNAARSSVLARVVVAMLFVALLPTWIPSRRVLSIDPGTLLREE